MNIVSLTSVCVDVFDGMDEVKPGGESLNFSANCCKFENIISYIIGAIGNDDYGKSILNAISKLRINTDCLHIVDGITANNRTYLTENGDRYYKPDSWTGGVYQNYTLSEQDISLISMADYVHTSVYCPQLDRILELKKQHPFKLAVDFNDCRNFDDWSIFIEYIDVFFISADNSVLAILRELSLQYDTLFIGTLAENGSTAYKNGKEYHVGAMPVEKVIDTTGCGDSYQAGFISSYVLNNDIIKAMNQGSELASQTLSHLGGF